MKKATLNIEFHNPNTDEETAKYIVGIFIEASRIKFENILKSCAAEGETEPEEESQGK